MSCVVAQQAARRLGAAQINSRRGSPLGVSLTALGIHAIAVTDNLAEDHAGLTLQAAILLRRARNRSSRQSSSNGSLGAQPAVPRRV